MQRTWWKNTVLGGLIVLSLIGGVVSGKNTEGNVRRVGSCNSISLAEDPINGHTIVEVDKGNTDMFPLNPKDTYVNSRGEICRY